MAFQNRFRKVETSDELIKKSIVAKILMAQGERSNLFRVLNNPTSEDMKKILAFRNFIDAFNTLFQDTRHNIGRSLKMKTDWPDKEKKYEVYLNKQYKKYLPEDMQEGLILFEEFTEDMVKVDLFKILDEIGEGGESPFEDEEDTEEEGE